MTNAQQAALDAAMRRYNKALADAAQRHREAIQAARAELMAAAKALGMGAVEVAAGLLELEE